MAARHTTRPRARRREGQRRRDCDHARVEYERWRTPPPPECKRNGAQSDRRERARERERERPLHVAPAHAGWEGPVEGRRSDRARCCRPSCHVAPAGVYIIRTKYHSIVAQGVILQRSLPAPATEGFSRCELELTCEPRVCGMAARACKARRPLAVGARLQRRASWAARVRRVRRALVEALRRACVRRRTAPLTHYSAATTAPLLRSFLPPLPRARRAGR